MAKNVSRDTEKSVDWQLKEMPCQSKDQLPVFHIWMVSQVTVTNKIRRQIASRGWMHTSIERKKLPEFT